MKQGIFLLEKTKDCTSNTVDYSVLNMNSAFKEFVNLEHCKHQEEIDSTILKSNMIQCILEKVEKANECKDSFYNKEKDMYVEIHAMNLSESKTIVCVLDTTDYHKKWNIQRKQMWDLAVVMEKLMEKRDLYTAAHQRKVAILATQMAIEMHLSKEQVESIYIASMLHDIGKISIPSEILTKPDKLTPIEYELMKTHVQNAYDILKGMQSSLPIAQIVKQHHEKLDGSGYPDQLTGEEILDEAKILTVADVYEAITSHRPYRPSLGDEFAILHLQEYSGVLYDKMAVEVCTKITKNIKWDMNDIKQYLPYYD